MVRGLNGNTQTMGYINTTITIDNNKYPIRFHVLNNLPSDINRLIGTNFLNQFNAIFDFSKMKISFTPPKYYNNVHKPARTELLTYVDTDTTGMSVVMSEQLAPHVFVANSLATPINGKLPVKLVNFSNKPAVAK